MPNWKKVIVSGSDAHLNTLEVTNTTTDDSVLITSTDAGSSAAPVLSLKRNSSSPADADYLGQIKFLGENDADQEIVYAKVTGKIQDASDSSEDGLIEFANKKAGSNVITARLRSDSLQLLNGTNLSVAGEATITGNISGSTIRASGDVIAFNSSDKRLKDNIIQIGSPLDKINKIGGYEFDWNENQQIYYGHDVGVIAQEIEEVIPEAVKDRDGGYKCVQYEKIIPLLIEGIKELDKKIKHIEKNCDCLNK